MSQEKVTTMSDLLASVSKVSSAAGLYALLVSGSGIISALNGTNILPLFPKTIIGDLDECMGNGIFIVDKTCTNLPIMAEGIVMLNLTPINAISYQILLRAGNSGEIYYRPRDNAGWHPWKRVLFASV